MHAQHQRRRLMQAGLLGSLGLLGRRAQACEFYTSTLRVTHPWTRATPDGADSAIVCMKFDEVHQADRLIGIQTELATSAVLGGLKASDRVDFDIPRGQPCELAESGTYLRLKGLTQPLEVGRSYPIRLVFAVGGTLNADLSVDYDRFR